LLSAFLRAAGFRVIGADISPAMLAVAARAALWGRARDLERRRAPRSVSVVAAVS
jgi:hypothetical protein